MRIALAQINPVIGDFSGNIKKITEYARKAKTKNQADIVLFPELSLCGYPPFDLLEHEKFIEQNATALRSLSESLPADLAAGLGYVKRNTAGKKLFNVYGIIHGNKVIFEQYKKTIIRHDYFDETRYFESGENPKIFEYKDERIGILLNDDAWNDSENEVSDEVKKLSEQKISMLVVPGASPFTKGIHKTRCLNAEKISSQYQIPVFFINTVGANDSVIFDGRSFAVGANGKSINAKSFEEDIILKNHPGLTAVKSISNDSDDLDDLEAALVLGIRDYMKKCGFKKAHLGLSGGIDSALVVYLAAKAIGAENVVCFNMPSQFSSQGSRDDSLELAENLGCRYETLPIEKIYHTSLSVLEDVFENKPFDVAEENLQARIRGLLWMAYSNKFNSMLLSAGNKSELAMGYCTLYGDTNGALAPIGDIFKTEVFALCKRINERSLEKTGKAIIPQCIIDKPPSAELRPGQKDQDSLPAYEILDEILKCYLYENMSPEQIKNTGYDGELVNRVVRTIIRSEWKRRQTPPVLKVSKRAFGIGGRMPLARAIYEV